MTKADTTKRLSWIDIVKIFAAFLIVMQHSLANEWSERMIIHDAQWMIINIAFMISRMGVPLFFMCSGATMLRRKHGIKEIFRSCLPGIIIPYASWMVIYGCIDAIHSSSVIVGVNCVIKAVIFGKYHTWFIATLIGLYLATPLIQEFVYDQKLLVYSLILSSIFTVILPYSSLIHDNRLLSALDDFNMHFVLGYILFYLAGYFLSTIKSNRYILIVGISLFLIVFIMCQGLCVYRVDDIGSDIQNYFSVFSIMGVILSVSLFVIIMSFANREFSARMSAFIRGWEGLGIGIYLIHPIFLPLIKDFHGLLRFVGVIVVYACAVGICLVVRLTPLRRFLLK